MTNRPVVRLAVARNNMGVRSGPKMSPWAILPKGSIVAALDGNTRYDSVMFVLSAKGAGWVLWDSLDFIG